MKGCVRINMMMPLRSILSVSISLCLFLGLSRGEANAAALSITTTAPVSATRASTGALAQRGLIVRKSWFSSDGAFPLGQCLVFRYWLRDDILNFSCTWVLRGSES